MTAPPEAGPAVLADAAPEQHGGGRRPGWGADLAVLAVHVALVLAFAHRTLLHLSTQLAGSSGDSAQFAWGLKDTSWALLHGHTPLLSNRDLAPGGVNLMWNTTTPLLGLLATPVTLLGGPVVTYNVVLLVVLVANGFVCYLALRRFVASRWARLVASLFFAFSGYLVPHAQGHLNLTSVFLVPVLLVLLHELLVARRWGRVRLGLALGATLAAQLLLTEEVLATEAVATVVGVVALAVLAPRRLPAALRDGLVQRAVTVAAIALALFAVVAAYPLWVQFTGPRRLSQGLIYRTEAWVTDVWQFWTPTSQQLTPHALGLPAPAFTGGRAEWNGHLGIPLLVALLLAVAWLGRRRLAVRWAALFAAAMAVLSLGPHLHLNGRSVGPPLPWALLERIGPLGNLLPSRLTLFTDLGIAVVLAVAVAELLRGSRRRMAAATVLLGVPTVVTTWPLALAVAPSPTPAFFTTAAVRSAVPADSTALVLPLSAEGTGSPDDVSAFIWQAQADMRFRMTGGYWLNPAVAGLPQIGPTRTPLVQHVLDIAHGVPGSFSPVEAAPALAELRSQQVTRVLLGPMQHRAEMTSFITQLLGRPGTDVAGVTVWSLDAAAPATARAAR
ncbi:MAG: hypothetical protein JWM67_1983 [Mycobacterium sp.]|nr:hypothetical protein [Mycobacterium sp.]